MRVRTRRSRPSGASIVPRRAAGRPSTSARYSRSSSRRASCALSAAWTASDRATTSSPDVSRSSRCTMPGARRGPRRPPRGPASACASVPWRCPRAGWTTTPAGLSTTSRCSSSHAIRELGRGRGRLRLRRAASATATASPPPSTWRLERRDAVHGDPARVDQPSAPPSASPRAAARNTSSRSPAASGGNGQLSRHPPVRPPSGGLAAARRPFEDVEEREHAEGDGDVGHVEGRPARGA